MPRLFDDGCTDINCVKKEGESVEWCGGEGVFKSDKRGSRRSRGGVAAGPGGFFRGGLQKSMTGPCLRSFFSSPH
jgi:hypothetical protein